MSTISTVSVGKVPWFAIQAAFFLCSVMLLLLAVRTLRYGPTVIVQGLQRAEMLPIHAPDSAYADAIGRRFLREYWTWSYSGHFIAKRRAAYLCTEDPAQQILSEASAKDSYYRKLLVTSQVTVAKATVTLRPDGESYLFDGELEVREWISFIATMRKIRVQLLLAPSDDSSRDVPLLVAWYAFEQRGASTPLSDVESRSDFDDLFTQAESLQALERSQTQTARERQAAEREAELFPDDDDEAATAAATPVSPTSSLLPTSKE